MEAFEHDPVFEFRTAGDWFSAFVPFAPCPFRGKPKDLGKPGEALQKHTFEKDPLTCTVYQEASRDESSEFTNLKQQSFLPFSPKELDVFPQKERKKKKKSLGSRDKWQLLVMKLIWRKKTCWSLDREAIFVSQSHQLFRENFKGRFGPLILPILPDKWKGI